MATMESKKMEDQPNRKLIVIADDMGLTKGVNEGILEAHCHGIVTGTSLMACGAAFNHAIQLLRETRSLSVGVHLTLTQERPILSRAQVKTLVTTDGTFCRSPWDLVWRYLTNRLSLDEVRLELEAQIEKVMSAGVKVSHLDGHQHVHVIRGISQIVQGLADKFGIPLIRYPSESITLDMLRAPRRWRRFAELMMVKFVCSISSLHRPTGVQQFAGFYFGGCLTKANLLKAIEELPENSVTELMCHPGREDASTQYAHWKYSWHQELEALTDEDVKQALHKRCIDLIAPCQVETLVDKYSHESILTAFLCLSIDLFTVVPS